MEAMQKIRLIDSRTHILFGRVQILWSLDWHKYRNRSAAWSCWKTSKSLKYVDGKCSCFSIIRRSFDETRITLSISDDVNVDKAVHTDIDKMTMKSYCDENSSSIRQNESSFGTSKKGKQILTHENYLHDCAEIVKKY